MAPPEKYAPATEDKVSSFSVKMDDLIHQLGNTGRFQMIMFILLCFNYTPLVFNHVIMAFWGAKSKHECHPRGQNFTIGAADTCDATLLFDNGQNQTVLCQNHGDWKYVVEERETTIVTEWDLVCDDAYLRSLATTIYFLGVMLGGLVFGYLSDKFGRRPVMLITLFTPVAIGVGIFFVPSYPWFVVLRLIEGIFLQGLQISSYVLVAEMFLPSFRPIAGGIIECFWGISVMILAGIVYLVRDWRYIQLAICLPTLLVFFYVCVIPESLRWLVTTGKLDQAEKLVDRMARFNKVEFPRESWMAVRAMAEGRSETLKQHYTFVHLMRTPRLRLRSIILFYLWFSVATGYYGLTFKITSLAGNKYLNFFIGACVEMAAYTLDIYIMKKLKRRLSCICFAMLAAVALITAGALPPTKTGSGIDLTLMSTGFAIVGRFAVAGLFSLIFMYTSELYPTVIRNIGMGTCAFWTRLGGVVAPQINSLGHLTNESVPIIVFGVMMLVFAIVSFFLPETLDQKLPETIDDVEGEKNVAHIVMTEAGEKDVVKETLHPSDDTYNTKL